MQTSTSTKTSTTIPDATTFDPLAFATATTAGLPFSYFLPSSTSTTSYPFSSLPSSLINPAASLYPFLSPDWFTSPSKFIDGFGNLPSTKSTGKIRVIFPRKKNKQDFLSHLDSKESTPHQVINENIIISFSLIHDLVQIKTITKTYNNIRK